MGAQYPSEIWDQKSLTRLDIDVQRAPDGHDWRALVAEVIAIQTQLQPLGIGATGVIPTSNPGVAGRLWADTAAVKVSAG